MPINPTIERLRNSIANALHPIKAHTLPKVCQELGLSEGTGDEAFSSKTKYVLKRLPFDRDTLLMLARKTLELCDDLNLEETIWIVEEEDARSRKTTESTRRNILDSVFARPDIGGRLGLIETLSRVMKFPSSCGAFWLDGGAPEVPRESLLQLSERRFALVLEAIVNPPSRFPDDGQRDYVDAINEHLRRDKLVLLQHAEESGYPIFKVMSLDNASGVEGKPKNLIFASNGPKPIIGFRDAINNEITILKNAEFCLIYDRPFPNEGLLWSRLIDWWISQEKRPIDRKTAAKGLGDRLCESLGSEAEKLLFLTYYRTFRPRLGDRLPALVPQVYLHYDPQTINQLHGSPNFTQQRMDFLMLLSPHTRIIIEIDGKQHYSDVTTENGALKYTNNDRASPTKYAAMVAEDRDLRLKGYEVYRFGGAELSDERKGKALVEAFFQSLFMRHNIRTNG